MQVQNNFSIFATRKGQLSNNVTNPLSSWIIKNVDNMYDLSDFLVNQGLSNTQIDKIKEYIYDYYGISYDTYIHDAKVQQIDKLLFLVSMKIEHYVYCDSTCKLEPHTILVDDSGCCTEMEFPIINYISWNLILMTKESDILIENQDNPDYCKKYTTVEKQAIMDNNGNILYEGELGDIKKARLVNHYLLLEKDKYTDLQKEQIYYYANNCIPAPDDYSDYTECPICGNDSEWNEKEKCYICGECKYHISGKHLSKDDAIAIHQEALNKLAASGFSEVFNSEEIRFGKYINDTPEEREERALNRELIKQYHEDDYENEEDYEQEPDYVEPYIDGKLYSVYDTFCRKLLFPFQPCKISAFPEGMPKGIYLANENDLKTTYCGFFYDSKVKSYPWALTPEPFSDMKNKWMHIYDGPMFFSVYDTFRTGPNTGYSFLQIYRKEPSKIEKYIISDHMYMTTDLLKELKDIEDIKDNNRAFSMLLAARDSKLEFKPINTITDEIRGLAAYRSDDSLFHMSFLTSWYDKMSFADVFLKDPQYVITLTKLNDISININEWGGLEHHDRLQEVKMILQKKREDDHLKYSSMWEEEERRFYEDEGYRDAYDGTPDAVWNND